MLLISELNIYPVKSLGGFSVHSSLVTSRGLQYDRRWMLVDEDNKFLTQREHPQMALLKTAIQKDNIIIYHSDNAEDQLLLPLQPLPAPTVRVNVWDDHCEAQIAGDDVNEWFSHKLSFNCKAVYMPESSQRKVDPSYAISEDDITSFSDACPVLLIGQASLDDLNSHLNIPVPMNRFRPNIVFTGGSAYQEDTMIEFKINRMNFYGVELCGRCAITTTNQETAERGKEPLKTLATYRNIGNKVCFGQNIICKGEGQVNVGDKIDWSC
jgi:uncharacterized protein YcbX